MSKQTLESAQLRADMNDLLLEAGRLWEGLRERARAVGAIRVSASVECVPVRVLE